MERHDLFEGVVARLTSMDMARLHDVQLGSVPAQQVVEATATALRQVLHELAPVDPRIQTLLCAFPDMRPSDRMKMEGVALSEPEIFQAALEHYAEAFLLDRYVDLREHMKITRWLQSPERAKWRKVWVEKVRSMCPDFNAPELHEFFRLTVQDFPEVRTT